MKKIITLIFAVLLNCQSAYGEEEVGTTGNKMYRICTDESKWGMCHFYYSGLIEGMYHAGGLDICPGNGATYGQSMDVAVNWLKNNPQNRHTQAEAHAYMAWRKAFPCNK